MGKEILHVALKGREEPEVLSADTLLRSPHVGHPCATFPFELDKGPR